MAGNRLKPVKMYIFAVFRLKFSFQRYVSITNLVQREISDKIKYNFMIFEQPYAYNCPDIHTGNNPTSGCFPDKIFGQIRPKGLRIKYLLS